MSLELQDYKNILFLMYRKCGSNPTEHIIQLVKDIFIFSVTCLSVFIDLHQTKGSEHWLS